MAADPEIEAIATIADALDKLNAAARVRVFKYLRDRFDMSSVSRDALPPSGAEGAEGSGAPKKLKSLSARDIYDGINPMNHAERALAAVFYLQHTRGQKDVSAGDVNSVLKDLGREVSNVTVALNKLSSRKLVTDRQSGHRARKRYSLTPEGIKRVRGMLVHSHVLD